MIQYRPYQLDCSASCLNEIRNGSIATLMLMATGLGKTEVYLLIAKERLDEFPDKKVLVIAHREELIFQPAERWHRDTGAYPAIEMAEMRTNNDLQADILGGATDDRIILTTIQTLNSGRRCRNCTEDCLECKGKGSRLVACPECDGASCLDCEWSGSAKVRCKHCQGDGWIKTIADCPECFECFVRRFLKFNPQDFSTVIIDEAHHATAESCRRVIRYFRSLNPQIRFVGPTATSDRADEEALGQVFDSVGFEFPLSDAIGEGWLVDIDQLYVTVEGLDFSRVRTTAGDLNEGDLDLIMRHEAILHKCVTPTIEVACGMEIGTIQRLIEENRVDEIRSFVTATEPTLVFAVSVAHAERMAEIINRYLPGSAQFLSGQTPRATRRDEIKRFQNGDLQFLVSCGIFLEGFDAPSTSIISMARPTKSRPLYEQAIGRGTRPLRGVVDGKPTPEDRKASIAASGKPKLTVLDFVGNSGKHKLISTADVLGGKFSDEIVEKAIRESQRGGMPVSMREMMERMQREEEDRRKQKARLDAQRRAEDEARLKSKAADQRKGIVAGANWHGKPINPFDVFEVAPSREPGWHKGRAATERQKEVLKKAGMDLPADISFWEATQLVGQVFDRRKQNLCTFKQAKILQKFGEATDVGFQEASRIIDEIAKRGWKPRRD